MKTCKRCLNQKPLYEFYKDQNNLDGHKAQCKKCFNVANYESRKRRQEPKPTNDSRLIEANYQAIERAILAFKVRHSLSVDIQKKGAQFPIKEGFRLFHSQDGTPRASFKIPARGLIEFNLSERTALELAQYVSKWSIEVLYG